MRRIKSANSNRYQTGLPPLGRRRAHRFWATQKWRVLTLVLVGIVFGCMGVTVYMNFKTGRVAEARAAFWRDISDFTARQGLVVGDILVDGRTRTGREALLQSLNMRRGMPILDVDLDALQAELQLLPWVQSARIERRLPNMIYVQLIERAPLAIWQTRGEMQVIDTNGAVILGANPAQFADLPVLVGADAPAHASLLLGQVTAHAELAELLQSAVRIGQRRWDLHLRSGMIVKLPETNAELALERLMQMQTAQQILQQNYSAIDLRLEDRVFLQKPGIAPAAETAQDEQGV